MLQYSLNKFFDHVGDIVVVDNIYHERGQQEKHEYFDWHTIYRLDQNENLNFSTRNIQFLPKSHRDDQRSNILELCDVLLGIFKDVHLKPRDSFSANAKKEILDSEFTRDFLVKRLIRNPKNPNSRYKYSGRFHISLFPNRKSDPETAFRSKGHYYDVSKINLAYQHDTSDPNQYSLFT